MTAWTTSWNSSMLVIIQWLSSLVGRILFLFKCCWVSFQISPILKWGYIWIISIFYFCSGNSSFLSNPVLYKMQNIIARKSYSSTFSWILFTKYASVPASLSFSPDFNVSFCLWILYFIFIFKIPFKSLFGYGIRVYFNNIIVEIFKFILIITIILIWIEIVLIVIMIIVEIITDIVNIFCIGVFRFKLNLHLFVSWIKWPILIDKYSILILNSIFSILFLIYLDQQLGSIYHSFCRIPVTEIRNAFWIFN